MPFKLNATRVLYQTSKFAPVAVIQLKLGVPEEKSFGLSKAQIGAGFSKMSANSSGGPLSISVEGTPIELYCDLVLELQRYAGHAVKYSRARAGAAVHSYAISIEYEDAATALYAGELAVDLLNALLEDQNSRDADSVYAMQQSLDEFVSFAQFRRLDSNSRLLMHAAQRQGVPVLRPDLLWETPTLPGATKKSGVIWFGWGSRQRQCEGSMLLGFAPQETLAQIADRAQLLLSLKDASIPLAGQDLEFINRNPVKRAQRSARQIGYPVTLRPRVALPAQYRIPENHVYGPLHSDADVALVAGHLRAQAGVDVWVESFGEGADYRFLILGNEMLCVVRGTPPALTGDGVHTITELAGLQAAATPDATSHRAWHRLAQCDSSVICRLSLAGLSPDSIPVAGKRIVLRGFGTLYNGGSCEDVTKEMPSRFSEIALQAARASGLEHLAGIEMNIADLTGATTMPNCSVSSVDPAPDLQEHGLSLEEDPHHVGEKYMALLFPAGRSPRIPTVAVTGTNGKTTTCRMVNRILRTSGLKTGLICTDGVYLDDELIVKGDLAGVQGARLLLMNPQTEAAVLETACGGMGDKGVGFDRCDVGACLNIAIDHLGPEGGIYTLDEMAVHKRQVIERTSGVAVLNAEDPRCLAMKEYTTANEVILIAHSVDHPAIKAHCQAGGRAIVTIPREASSEISILDSLGITPLLDVNQIPATINGTALFNIENAMAAIAMSVGLGISNELVVKGLSSFRMTSESTPGRMNIYDGLPFRVIVDYAHNAHGVKAFFKFVDQQEVKGRRIGVLLSDGRKSDDEIRAIASLFANQLDHFICRDAKTPLYLGGRAKGEIPAMIQSVLIEHHVEKDKIEIILDPEEAVDQALSMARPGDIVVIFFGHHFLEQIKNFAAQKPEIENVNPQSILSN